MEKIRIGISACLLGRNVRYDGGHRHDRHLTDTLGRWFDWVPVCPEVEYGLPVPREAMRLVGDPGNPRLFTIRTHIDHTDGMLAWAKKRLTELAGEGLSGFVFKSRSPSSGMAAVKVYGRNGRAVKRGTGIFAGAFMRRFPLLPVEEEDRLSDPLLRENFVERIFVYRRWTDLEKRGGTAKEISNFHADHGLLILSHSPKHMAALNRLVADPGRQDLRALRDEYPRLLMEALRLPATVPKQTRVLSRVTGHLQKRLSPNERQELVDAIERYRQGLLPLLIPVTLIEHYARLYNDPYLKSQVYLHPHPQERMLRNHG